MRLYDGVALGIERHGTDRRSVSSFNGPAARRVAFARLEVHLMPGSQSRMIVASVALCRADVTNAAVTVIDVVPMHEGKARLRQQASWLRAGHPDAAVSLLEGLDEVFTVNRLGLTPALMRCLATTNLIENPNGCVRRVTHRVCRYRDAEMALRWTATGFLEAEKGFRRLQGHRDRWVLATALGRHAKTPSHANSKVA